MPDADANANPNAAPPAAPPPPPPQPQGLAAPAPIALPAHGLTDNAVPVPPGAAAGGAAGGAGARSFGELLLWAWTAYERLGSQSTSHQLDAADHDLARGGALDASYQAADISDLGRLLFRMLLQPYKFRAAAANPPPGGGSGGGPGGGGPPGQAAAAAEIPPDQTSFSPALQTLLLEMLHASPRQRPSARRVLSSEWARQRVAGVPTPLCACWKLVQSSGDTCGAAPSDLRLLRRPQPPLSQISLANSAAVTDEWLEVLAAHHPLTIRRLDLRGCDNLSATERPLAALAQLKALEVLRLPRERWAEREIAKFLTRLPHLRSVDSSTLTDLRSERDALDQQCHILDGLADVARISVSPRDKRR